jgi:hypothetical protein
VPARADDGVHLVDVDQLARAPHPGVRVGLRVLREELDRLAGHAAGLVDLLGEQRVHARHRRAVDGAAAGERRENADAQRLGLGVSEAAARERDGAAGETGGEELTSIEPHRLISLERQR